MNESGKPRFFSQIGAMLSSEKGRRILIIAGIVGILLIALSEILPKTTKKTDTITDSTGDEFVRLTEQRLSEIIGSIRGAGECKIMVTLENGVEYVYATEEKRNSDYQENNDDNSKKLTQRDDNEESVILVDTGNGREGLLVTEIQPSVRGVVVVCEGGDDTSVRDQIINAVTVALNISSKRVCVTTLS